MSSFVYIPFKVLIYDYDQMITKVKLYVSRYSSLCTFRRTEIVCIQKSGKVWTKNVAHCKILFGVQEAHQACQVRLSCVAV